jgi:hypothetical protein
MSDLARLEAAAEEKRARLTRTLRNIEKRTTFLGLADEVIARSGGAPDSGEIIAALRRNPILAAGLALCAGLLIIEVNRIRKQRVINGRGRLSFARRAQMEEFQHGSRRTEYE